MKKLVSLVMVLAMVLCMATAAFADTAEQTTPVKPEGEGTQNSPYMISDLTATYEVTIPSYESTYTAVLFEVPEEADGWDVVVSGGPVYVSTGMGNGAEGEESASVTISYGDRYGNWVTVMNNGTTDATFTISYKEPAEGSKGKPAALPLDEKTTVFPTADQAYSYYYSLTPAVGGTLTITVNDYTAMYYISVSTDMGDTYITSANNETSLSVDISTGEKAVVQVIAAENVGFSWWAGGYGEGSTAAVAITAEFEEAEAGTYLNPVVVDVAAKPADIEMTAGVIYKFTSVENAILTIKDSDAVALLYSDWDSTYTTPYTADEDGVVTYECSSGESPRISVTSGEKTTVTMNVNMPLGYKENPEVIEDIDEIEAASGVSGVAQYYYKWVADADGLLEISIKEDSLVWVYPDYMDDDPQIKLSISADDTTVVGLVNDSVSAVVNKDAEVLICVEVIKDSYGYAYPVEVVLNGTVHTAGSEKNPIVINEASELGGVDVSANGETYIAVSSMLNGQVLTIIGDDNTTVTVNGTAVTADNGVFTVVLTGVPANKVVVANKGSKDASYVAGIAYPAGTESNPIMIDPTAGAVKAEAAAGSTTYYAINGSYNGNYVVVTGEGLTVTVNGTEVKASNGKYVVELTGTPVNSIVVANSGTAAAAYSIVTSDNPPTGDAGILMPVVAALVSVMGAAVLVIKKKEN